MILPNNVRAERLRRGMTQFDLAIKTRISQADICQIELCKVTVFPGWRQRLAEALGVPEEKLFPEVYANELSRAS